MTRKNLSKTVRVYFNVLNEIVVVPDVGSLSHRGATAPRRDAP